jgi:hypothetical protein
MAGIEIHWAGLVQVTEVAFVFGVGIVVVFALGVLGLAQVERAGAAEEGSASRAAGYAVAALAFTVCAAAVGYGLYLIIPQFHR